MITIPDNIVSILIGKFPLSPEMQAFWMAFQGAMVVRTGRNKNKDMAWFHAFVLSVLSGYAGSAFAFLWVGKPSSLLSNDLSLGSCIIAFLIVNCTPKDIGFKLGKSIPIVIITTLFAELFRVGGLVKFVDMGYNAFKDNPSEYYPIPVFGPIVLGTLLGNMGGFFTKGFDAYLNNGMPWRFQNGLFSGSFYHFFVHDSEGFIGQNLRYFVNLALKPFNRFGIHDDRVFAFVCVSVFMHTMSLIHLPFIYGPGTSPFNIIHKAPTPNLYSDSSIAKKAANTKQKKN